LRAPQLPHPPRRRAPDSSSAPLLHARRKLRDLSLRMRPGVLRIRDQPIDRPALNLIRRPCSLARAHNARGRAPAKVGKLSALKSRRRGLTNTHGVMMPGDGADQLRKFDAILSRRHVVRLWPRSIALRRSDLLGENTRSAPAAPWRSAWDPFGGTVQRCRQNHMTVPKIGAHPPDRCVRFVLCLPARLYPRSERRAPRLLAPRQPQSNVRRAHSYRLTA
jgi:hypothetical protein